MILSKIREIKFISIFILFKLDTPNFDVNENNPDYDYYDTRSQQPLHRRRFMQGMRRNWNPNNRDVRSEDEGKEEKFHFKLSINNIKIDFS